MSATTTALKGIEQAFSRLDRAAVNLSHAGQLPNPRTDTPVAPVDTVALSTEMVDLIQARNDVAINVKVARTDQETQRAALDLLA